MPAKWKSRWIDFVVRPRLWQHCVTAVVSAIAAAEMQAFFADVAFFQDGSAICWPVNGIALGVLLVARRQHWPAILAGFGVGVGISESAEPPHTYLSAALVNMLQVWLPALFLPKFRGMDRWLAQPGVASRFLCWAVIAASALSGALGPLYGHGRPGDPYWLAALRWAGGDVLGCALATPLVLSLVSRETWELFRPAMLGKTMGLVLLMTVSSWFVFNQSQLPIGFILYPMILLLGTQLGLSGAVIAINLVALIATDLTLHAKGPFGSASVGPEFARIFLLQVYLALSVSMSLPVSVARVRRLTIEAKLQRAWAATQKLASLDGLTAIANRRHFDLIFDQEWKRASRARSPLSLLIIDVDRFKAYNDTYGHLTGDACLRTIAKAISGVPGRPTDLVARYGGEEFVVLLPGSTATGASLIAERIRMAVEHLALPHLYSDTLRVTVSIGLATSVPDFGSDSLLLIAMADKALYNAKHEGRNQVCTAVDAVAVAS